jgi:transposase
MWKELSGNEVGSGDPPIFHKLDETLRGHVFCSFLALVLRKELDRRLEKASHCFEWADIKQDLKALQDLLRHTHHYLFCCHINHP